MISTEEENVISVQKSAVKGVGAQHRAVAVVRLRYTAELALLSAGTQQFCHRKTKGRELGCEQGQLQLSAKEREEKVRSCYGQQSSNL
jgi:hypothetical protein